MEIQVAKGRTITEWVRSADGSITFTVALSDHAFHPVVVNYATANGTVVAPTDYTATSGSFAARAY